MNRLRKPRRPSGDEWVTVAAALVFWGLFAAAAAYALARWSR